MQFILSAAPLIAALFGIYLTSLYGYLLFHGLAEGIAIVIACGVFMIAWNARKLLRNHYLLFVGIAYLFVGGIDFLHTLAYKGMGVFEGYGANLPTQLWIAGRYVEALSLLLGTIFLHRKLSPRLTLLGYGLSTGLLLGSIFYWKVFPDCFVEGVGLTPFKIYSEYSICVILLAAIGLLIKNSMDLDRKVLILLVASIAATIAQELAFTTYLSVYGPSNMIGHLLKIVSFYLIYKAIIETSLVSPWKLLFLDLKRSEAKFRSIFETNVVPIAYCHTDGRVIDANDEYLKLLGFTREELETGKVRWDVVTPPEWKPTDETGLGYLRRDGVCPPLEKEYLRRDGTRVPVLVGACRVPGDSEQVVAFAVDLTEQKKMEGELRKARDELEVRVQERTAELERVNRDLADFNYIAAHDLQEPLRLLVTLGDRLAIEGRECSSQEGRYLTERIQSSARRASTFIRDIHKYSMMSSRKEPFTQTDLNSVVREVLTDFEELVKQKGAVVEVENLPSLEVDAHQMGDVFRSLLSNALKFTGDEKPRIRISGEAIDAGKQHRIIVEDNGIGFDEVYLNKIFSPFQRLHGRSRFEGSGIGLALCRKVLERHGGSITARSKPNHGSTFTITLPVSRNGRI